MITRKQKRSILYILFVFILCSAAKDFEFLVLKTDETFLAENIFCKVFAILVISQCLVERKLSWRSIGFRLKGIKKGLILGFSLGLSTFAISYLAEFLILFFMGKSPRLSFYISNFALSDQTVTGISLSALLICILGNVINVTGGGRTFPRIDLQAGPEGFFHPERQLHSGSALWYLAPCYRCRMVQRRQPHAGAAFLMGIGYIILAGILGFEWVSASLSPEQSGPGSLNIFSTILSVILYMLSQIPELTSFRYSELSFPIFFPFFWCCFS